MAMSLCTLYFNILHALNYLCASYALVLLTVTFEISFVGRSVSLRTYLLNAPKSV